MMRISTIILLSVLYFSCSEHESVGDETQLKLTETTSELIITPDSVVIDGGQLITDRRGDSYYRSRPFSGMIQKVDLNNGKVENFMLPNKGPDAIRRVNYFLIDDSEDMVVFSDNSAYWYAVDGALKKSMRLSVSDDGFHLPYPYLIRVDANHPVFQYGDKYIVSIERGDADKFSFPYHYKGSVFGLMDVEKKTVDVLPVEWEKTENFYGGLHTPHATLNGDVLVYGYKYSPNLLTYNLSTGESDKKEVAPISGVVNEPFYGASDPGETIAHMGKSITYDYLRFDTQNNLYYQMCLVPVPEGEPGFGRARWRAIRVFSKELKLIGDLKLRGYYQNETLFQNGKFFVRYTKDVGEDVLLYKGFELKED